MITFDSARSAQTTPSRAHTAAASVLERERRIVTERVQEAVQSALIELFGPCGRGFAVTVTPERVLLSGRVTSYFVKQRAGHAAMAVADGIRVINDVTVR